ncbi:hypothetical protein DIPPA_05282, partial [Diplonema papillatum]
SVRGDWVCVCPAPSMDYAVAGAAVCTVAPCLHDTEKPCLEDLAGCTWDKESDPMCYKTPCVTAKKTVCEEDAACVWSSYSPSAATAALVYEMSTAIFPFENVTCFTIGCFTCDAPQPGIRVEFVKGYLPEKDSLACATCSAANVSLNFNKETGVLQMGPATSRSLLTALAGLSFITQTDDASKRTLSWRFGTTADGSDATTCTTGPHTVDLVMGHCALLRCEYTDASKCTDDAACLWVGGNMDPCTVAPCVEYPSEKSCNRDEACEYSVDSADAGCVLRRCPLLETERECLVEDVCMWNAGACVDKDCSIVDERCACEQEKTCAWVALGSQGRCVGEEFGTCPAMDITVLLSGSVSLSGAFARHPKGFYAIIETLRDWVTALPLTSEGSAVGKQSTAANGGMRLAFIQFSGTPAKNAIQTPAGVGASGSFSGKRSELTGDLIWHEDNFLQGGNIVTTGLGRAADLFSADSAAGRKRVLIVLSDTKIEGVEGSADAIAALRSCKWDTSASTAVCGTEHCSSLTAEGATVCNGDAGCTYDATMRSCEEFRCKYHGKSHACRTDSNCFWNTNEGSCTEVQYGSCPTLDIVVLFDGSSALSQSFGKHPQAFVGILEIFRDWLREFPLAAGSSATGGAQVLFVQFAGGASAQAKVNTESSGAQGQPSGVLSELNTDLTWHENEFYGSAGPSKVEKALEEALAALSGSQTRTASKKVVLIVAGGEISDASEVASQRSALEKIGASIFGVFVRRFETETDADKTALKSLTNTVSVPKDVHVTSVDISSLYSGALHTFCDANTGFGQDIADVSPTHNPCTVYLERSTCLEDSFCSWLDESTCVTTPCVHHTDELTCNADDTNTCKYNQTMAECERRVVKPCLERTAAECLETDGCAVSDDGLTCGEKTCYHGSEQSCRSDVNDCVWVGGPLGCEKRKCSHKTEEACSANATCSWVVAGVAGEGAATFAKFTEVGLFPDHQCTASLCADASCSTVLPSTESLVVKITEGYQQGKDTLFCRLCLSLGIQASWDAPSSTLSLSTVNGLAVLSYSQALANVSFSTVSDDDTVRDFAWSFVGDKCATGKGSAEVVAASCQVKRCQYDAQPLCNSDPYCQWNVTTCSQKLCTHINSELTCGRQEECHWSVDSSEGMCMQRACAKFKDSMDMCKSNSGCMWDDTKTVKCIETDCKVMESCRCQQDSDCFWRASEGACVAVDFALCPLMDVVFAFSGASAFGVPYGKHPHGFYAVVEMLRDWVGQAPLTTEKASIGAQSVETSGVRVALIQFAGKRTANLVVGSVATAPGSSGAGGQLSGDLGEVAGDLNWHEANYKGQDRFVSRALTTAAMTFNMDSPKDGRKKVVIVIADGALDDESVADARASLDALGVQTFVVLVHRFSSETPEDTQATKALAQLASSDNHFASVPLNELSGTVLNSLCDPTSTWGSLLLNATAISTDGNHKPCAFYSEQSTCTTDTACAWSTGYSVCLPSRCTSNCEKTTCTDECEWDDTLARCLAYVPETRLKCVSAVEEVCLSDSDCLYDVASGICATRACYHEDEEGCIADATGCGWSTVNQTCSAKQCAAGDRESCVAESMCEWEETCGAGCIVKPCAHAGESTCAGDPQCEWLNGECAVLPCAGYANEKCCDQFDDCQWDVRTSPAVCAVRPCVTAAGKDACDAESGCMWFGAPEKCVEKSCDLLGTDDKCACNADTDCYFVSAATGAHCTLQQYGSCPTMDIVMLLDGGASMSTVFGRHPVGFYGLIEIIRQWAKHLPLSKDTADVTAPLADTQTTRLSFVQFAGSSEWDAGDSRQILTPGITDPGTSGGRLTGSLSEINTDLTFHSDNPLAQGSGKAKKYLSAALDKAGKMLGTSPVDGRKKVVIVLVNGELDDASEYRGYKTVLNALQAEVFGAALSRAGTDAGAVSDLNNYVVSEPKEGRARSVTLDTLGEVLSSLCDPMDAWGQYLVDESTSCAQATLRKTCLKNGGCTWSDQLLTCESSPCIAHCDELACEADTTNNCAGEDGCSSDAAAGCEWTLNATCVVRACVTIDNQVSCEADSAEHNCVWSSVTGQCLVEQCGYIGKEACTADDLCSWGAEGCAFKLCTMYADDFECSSHPRCSWDVSAPPGMCRVTTCGTHDSEAECGHYNTSCMWSTGGNETADGACVKKGCQDVGSACECASNAECFWSVGDGYDCQAAAFGQCPAMDVLFAVDGSQNMASSFGRHPNGFAAVLEFVMDWTMQAPLTGGKPSKGVRVAMFQFSTGVTTGDNGGKLSGDAALIAKNVAWHAGSMNGGSSVAAG